MVLAAFEKILLTHILSLRFQLGLTSPLHSLGQSIGSELGCDQAEQIRQSEFATTNKELLFPGAPVGIKSAVAGSHHGHHKRGLSHSYSEFLDPTMPEISMFLVCFLFYLCKLRKHSLFFWLEPVLIWFFPLAKCPK